MLNALLLAATYDPTQVLIGLLVGVVLLIVMVTMTKINAFVALILSAMIVALIGGIPGASIPGVVASGFGGTLGTIGIIIGFGVIMGQIFEESGAAEKMARVFIKLFGKGREDLALALTGFIVSIPIFCDSAFVILFPIAKAISQKTRKNLVVIAGALAAGLVVTHTMVPPTPGPLAVAGSFGVDIGTLIIWGIIFSVPQTIAALIYVRWIGKKLVIIPNENGELERVDPLKDLAVRHFDLNDAPKKDLPSAWLSFAPIVVPIILIVINNIVAPLAKGNTELLNIVGFIGAPIPAVAVGVLIAIYGLGRHMDRETALKHMEAGVRQAGIILLVTGAGGALGGVIKETGVGLTIANTVASWGLPLILLPLLIATIVRFIQGSGTVSLVTSASISAPILAAAGINPLFGALSAMIGGLFFAYFNDSYFHIVNRSIGITNSKEQLKFWSGVTTVAWAAGIVVLLVTYLLLGKVVGV